MVGTMKRYDPAYERLAELMGGVRADLRLVRVTTLESPFGPYVAHYPLVAGDPPPAEVTQELQAADERALDARWAPPTSTPAGATAGFCSTTWCTSSTRCAASSASRRRSSPPTWPASA